MNHYSVSRLCYDCGMRIDKTVGRNLTQLRDGVTQEELAERMRERGYSWTKMTVYNIERGERQIRLAEAVDVLNCLGKPVDYLSNLIAPEGGNRNDLDRMIGQNVEILRNGIDSVKIAQQMCDRGHAWTPRTIDAIECGERPLALSEAVDLMSILGQDDMWALERLLSGSVNSTVSRRCKSIEDLAHRILQLWKELDARRSKLAVYVHEVVRKHQGLEFETWWMTITALEYSEQEYLLRRHMRERLLEDKRLDAEEEVPNVEDLDVETFRAASEQGVSDEQHGDSIEDQLIRNLDNAEKLEELRFKFSNKSGD